MAKQDIELLDQISVRLLDEPYSPVNTARRLIRFGGIDMSNLTEEDVVALICGTFSGDWSEPGFSFGEIQACYMVMGKDFGKSQVIDWVTAVFILADALERGHSDLQLQIRKIVSCLSAVWESFEPEELIYILRRVVGPVPEGRA